MKLELAIAGMCCFVLAFGHTVLGWRWILPHPDDWTVPRTPFGSSRLSLGMDVVIAAMSWAAST